MVGKLGHERRVGKKYLMYTRKMVRSMNPKEMEELDFDAMLSHGGEKWNLNVGDTMHR
jgi:hypothetical protein